MIFTYILFFAGFAALVKGADLLVDGASSLAKRLGVSALVIGLTIVAFGTSTPELIVNILASIMGNIVGSNIFNILWILGVSAVIRPLPFSQALMSDVLVTVIATFLLFMSLFVGKRHILERWQGICFIALYVVYIVYLVIRG